MAPQLGKKTRPSRERKWGTLPLAASPAGPEAAPEPAARRDRSSAAATATLECGSPLPLSFKPDGAGEARARIKPVEERKAAHRPAKRGCGELPLRFGRLARSGPEPAARRDGAAEPPSRRRRGSGSATRPRVRPKPLRPRKRWTKWPPTREESPPLAE